MLSGKDVRPPAACLQKCPALKEACKVPKGRISKKAALSDLNCVVREYEGCSDRHNTCARRLK